MKAARKTEEKRLAVYCIHCEMWFDTKKGWQAKQGAPPFAIPLCPCCSAPLMQIDYDEFIQNNQKQGRLDEVMTWEYPHGSIWKQANLAGGTQ